MQKTIRAATALSLLFLLGGPVAQAGVIEDLLAKPAIQSLLGRQADLQSVLRSCGEARYRQRNTKACQEAEEAARVARIPPELRAVLATPNASASMRQICLAVQGTPAQASYLCVEMGKADPAFNTQLEQQRAAVAQQLIQQGRGPGASAEQSR